MAFVLPQEQDSPAFDAQAALDATDLLALVAALLGNGVVSGFSASSAGGLTIAVAAGVAQYGGATRSTAGGNATITTASSNDRRDIIIQNAGGTLAVVQGTPCAVAMWTAALGGQGIAPPVKPAIPAGAILLAEVYVPGGASSLTSANIIQKQATIGQWDLSGAASAAQSAAQSYALGLVNAEATTRANADTTLQGNINSEASTRASGDTTNANAIAAETARAQAAEALLAPKASPALTGTPTAPTPSALDNSTKLATTAYADSAVAVEASARATAVTNEASTRASADALRLLLSGGTMTGPLYASENPISGSEVATKAYVDGIASGLSVKPSARVCGSANVALSGLQTIDGITLSASDRVLLIGQTTASQNGLWVAAAGAWTRPSDFASGATEVGSFVFIEQGTINAGAGFALVGAAIVVDTGAQTWTQFSGAGEVIAGTGLLKTGNRLDVDETVIATVASVVSGDAATLASAEAFSTAGIATAISNARTFNVIQYGADPTGANDSSTAVTNAQTALKAAGGGILLFPPGGTYKFNTGIISRTVLADTQMGIDARGSVLKPQGSGIAINTTMTDASYWAAPIPLAPVVIGTLDLSGVSAGGIGIKHSIAVGAYYDAWVANGTASPTGSSDNGVRGWQIKNTIDTNSVARWTERTVFGPNSGVANCYIGIEFDAANGRNSFGYTDMERFVISISAVGQRAVVVRGSGSTPAQLYNSILNWIGNNGNNYSTGNIDDYIGTFTDTLASGSTVSTLGFSGGTNVALYDGQILIVKTSAAASPQAVMVRGNQASGTTTLNVYQFKASATYTGGTVEIVPAGLVVGWPGYGAGASADDNSTLSTSALNWHMEGNGANANVDTVPLFIYGAGSGSTAHSAALDVFGTINLATYSTGLIQNYGIFRIIGSFNRHPNFGSLPLGQFLASTQNTLDKDSIQSTLLYLPTADFTIIAGALQGDAKYRFYMSALGYLDWAGGSGNADISLYRSATGTLRIGDASTAAVSGGGGALSLYGLNGAQATFRFAGCTASGAPSGSAGPFTTGDVVWDLAGKTMWFCTAGGSPGTWSQINAAVPSPSGSVGGDLGGTLPNPTVVGLQGYALASTSPSGIGRNAIMAWLGAGNWGPVALTTDLAPQSTVDGGYKVVGLYAKPIDATTGATPPSGGMPIYDGASKYVVRVLAAADIPTIPLSRVTGAAPTASPTFTGTVTVPDGANATDAASLEQLPDIPRPSAQALKWWTNDPASGGQASLALSSGVQYFFRFDLASPKTLGNGTTCTVNFRLGSAAASSISNAYVGIYNAAGTLLAVSSDVSSQYTGANAVIQATLTVVGGQSISTLPRGSYYASIVYTTTGTAPTFLGGNSIGTTLVNLGATTTANSLAGGGRVLSLGSGVTSMANVSGTPSTAGVPVTLIGT